MKRIIVLIICAVLICALSACENNGSENLPTNTNPAQGNQSDQTNPTTQTEITTEPLLSEQCDVLLSCGYDRQGNYYELVGTQEETSTSVVIKIGVIKNNQWLMPLSSDSCFLNDDGLIPTTYGGEDLYSVNSSSIDFIDIGGFMFERQYYDETNWYKLDDVLILNCNTRQHMVLDKNEEGLEYYYSSLTSYDSKSGRNIANTDNGLIIIQTAREVEDGDSWSTTYSYDWYTLNLHTFRITLIGSGLSTHPAAYCYLSEGLIFAYDYCFYDTNLNKVLDLSNMNLQLYDYRYECIVFKNGLCTFKTKNSVGTEFLVTIDKSGNIISEEKLS